MTETLGPSESGLLSSASEFNMYICNLYSMVCWETSQDLYNNYRKGPDSSFNIHDLHLTITMYM